MRLQGVHLASLVYQLPDERRSTRSIEEDLAPLYARMGMSPGWLETVTGIRERRLWPAGTLPSSAAAAAGRQAMERAGLTSDRIGLLINSSVSRDYLEPSTACRVHQELSLKPSCLNFDLGNACLGFLNGMLVAGSMIQTGQVEAALVTAGENSRPVLEATLERLSDRDANIQTFKDELASLTLGSAAVAAVLTRESLAPTPRPFFGGLLRAATEHSHLCRGTTTRMVTDAVALLQAGVTLARETWDAAQRIFQHPLSEAREFAMHQVGQAHHHGILRALGLPRDRALEVYPQLGNIGAAGVPLTLARAAELGRIQPGDPVALMGIGSGLNCAMLELQW